MIAVVDLDDTFRGWAVEQVRSLDDVLEFVTLPEAAGAIEGNAVDVLVIGPNQPADDVIASIEAIIEHQPNISIVTVLATNDPRELRHMVHAGARDVLTYPFDSDELLEAAERARELATKRTVAPAAAAAEGGEAGATGKVIMVFSTKGGSGKSLIATNLPMLLGRRVGNENVALVDLDLQSGDVSIMLDLDPQRGLFEAAESAERLDIDALRGFMTKHKSGIDVLTAPPDPSQAEAVSPSAVTAVLTLLKSEYQYVVVDSPPLFTDQVLAAFDVTDQFILVASMDIPSLKNLRVALNTMRQLGIGSNQIKVAINRANSKVGLSLSDVEKSLDIRVSSAIPSSREVPLSYNQAEPIAMSGSANDVIEALENLLPDDLPTEAGGDAGKGRFRLFSRG